MTQQHPPKAPNDHLGAVIIGRNEGNRLIRCIEAAAQEITTIVYVDSGSTDHSVAEAEARGVHVVSLNLDLPFTASRARNEGLEALKGIADPKYVQFIDGDCELQPGWVKTAQDFLDENPKVAVAFGRVRERFPEASVYNKLGDEEWQGPIGKVKACGGISLMRVSSLDEVEGFDPYFIAAEDDEVCLRMRAKGWEVWRLDTEMVLHDLAMTKVSQWWMRCKRNGVASALCRSVHGAPPEKLGVLRTYRALGWGLALPLITLVLTLVFGPLALILLLAYPVQVVRRAVRMGAGDLFSWQSSFFMTLSKFPELQGVISFHWGKFRKQRQEIVEFK